MNKNIKNYSLLKDLENLQKKSHLMLLYDNEEYANLVKCCFVEIGLKKGETCIILTHDDPKLIEKELESYGIDVKKSKQKNQLHIFLINNIIGEKKESLKIYKELLQEITANLNPPYRIIGRLVSNVSTKIGIEEEIKIECDFHSNFENYDCSFLCTYSIADIEKSNRAVWLEKLIKAHHNLFYASNPFDSVSFDTDLLKLYKN